MKAYGLKHKHKAQQISNIIKKATRATGMDGHNRFLDLSEETIK